MLYQLSLVAGLLVALWMLGLLCKVIGDAIYDAGYRKGAEGWPRARYQRADCGCEYDSKLETTTHYGDCPLCPEGYVTK